MNKTKKLTTGAMLLAIVGALMLIDRQLSYLFTEIVLLMIPVVIAMYCAMYTFKDCLVLSVCLLIIGYILGSVYSYFYVPLTIIVGIAYSWGITKDYNKKKLLLISIGTYMVGEVLIMLLIRPLFGLNLNEMMQEMEVSFKTIASQLNVEDVYSTAGIDIKNMLSILYVITLCLTGLLEGVLTHLTAIILMKRFKIKDFTKGGLITFELNPLVAYICFASVFSFYFIPNVNNETIKYIFMCLGIFGALILVYYGYLFAVTYFKKKMPNNKRAGIIPMLLILIFPVLAIRILVICGFLLGAGPLKKVLDKIDLNIK